MISVFDLLVCKMPRELKNASVLTLTAPNFINPAYSATDIIFTFLFCNTNTRMYMFLITLSLFYKAESFQP